MTTKRTGLKWSYEEDRFLERHFKTMSDKEIADILGRTEIAVIKRRTRRELVATIPCPKCNETTKIGVVSTYIPNKNTTKSGFYCRNCLTEYLKNGKIIPPYEASEEKEEKSIWKGNKTRKTVMFELLDKARKNNEIVNREEIMKKADITLNTYYAYRRDYKKERCLNE